MTCVDTSKISASLVGHAFDAELLSQLPPGVEPWGENGEFHTCVLAGPMFQKRLAVRLGDVVEREGFCFADLVPIPPA